MLCDRSKACSGASPTRATSSARLTMSSSYTDRHPRTTPANCGVVRCALHEGGGAELYRLDLVCQVTADEATGELRRVIYSPLGD